MNIGALNGLSNRALSGPSMNLGIGLSLNISANPNIQNIPNNFGLDNLSLSGLGSEPFNGNFANLFGNNTNALSSLGMGNIPGFGNACNPMGSMFGGMMQMINNQTQMINMMMMMLMMMLQKQMANGFGGMLGGGLPGSCGIPGLGNGAASPCSAGGAGAPSGAGGTSPTSGAGAAAPNTKIPSFGKNPSKQQINQQLEAAAKKYGIPPNILKAVAWQESGWRANALSYDGQHGKGVMQIDDRSHQFAKTPQVFDSAANIDYGAKFLSNLYKQTGDWNRALKRYNGGSSYPPKIMSLAQSKPWQKYL